MLPRMDTRSEQPRAQRETAYHVDDLMIDVGRQRVLRSGQEIPITGLSFDLLLALARASPNMLTYDQLMERVWQRQVINIETVSQRVKLVRDALGDDSRSPRYILGVRGRGYRMIATVTPVFDAVAPARELLTAAAAAPTTDDAISTAKPTRRRVAVLVATVLLCTIAIVLGMKMRSPAVAELPRATEPSSIVVHPPRTIAVLPFSTFSGDTDSEYFGDGLAEELLSRLAGVPGLHVAARTSAFYFKNRSDTAQAIGRALGVRHLLEGSVRKFGTRVRVTAQLIDTTTGYQLWSQTFDREITDTLAIQDEISLAVVAALNVALIDEARAELLRPATENPQALDLYLRARYLTQEWQLRDLDQAIDLYEKALRADPGFGAAYVGLASALHSKGQFGVPQENPARPRIRELLRKALEINPQSGDAHAMLGGILLQTYDIAGAERELLLAEKLNPNGEHVLYALASFYATAGWPPDRALTYAYQWERLDPLNPWASTYVAIALWQTNQPKQALAKTDEVLAANPDYWVAQFVRTAALVDLDRYQEALASATRARQLNPEWTKTLADVAATSALVGDMERSWTFLQEFERREPTNWCFRAWVLAARNDYEGAMWALENAYAARDPVLIESLHYRQYLPLHGDPRFQHLVRLFGQERRAAHVQRLNPALAARNEQRLNHLW